MPRPEAYAGVAESSPESSTQEASGPGSAPLTQEALTCEPERMDAPARAIDSPTAAISTTNMAALAMPLCHIASPLTSVMSGRNVGLAGPVFLPRMG